MARALYTAALYLLTPALLLRLLWRARRQPEYLRHLGERFGPIEDVDAFSCLFVEPFEQRAWMFSSVEHYKIRPDQAISAADMGVEVAQGLSGQGSVEP